MKKQLKLKQSENQLYETEAYTKFLFVTNYILLIKYMSISHIKKKHMIAFIMKSMPKKLKPACLQDNPVLKLNSASNDRLLRSFYARNSDILAKKLLGKILCRRDLVTNETIKNKATSNSIILKARIVETEMYPGVQDPASHSFQGKKTKRNGAMFMDPGVCYVYNIYGMYQCKFNIYIKLRRKVAK